MDKIVIFCILAVFVLGSAVLCVSTKRIMRAATFLLFVLFGVAGFYFLMGYTFLGAAQISVYAGGITMMYVFAIQLVSKRTLQGMIERFKGARVGSGLLISVLGLLTVGAVLMKNQFINTIVTTSRNSPWSKSDRLCLVQRNISMYFPLSSFQCSCWLASSVVYL